ncbi:hypothetical protein Acr_05g0016030 [Actinidia rufa]|uniref:Uncharacterized protein n=1 Tax=Actinidia rufa TaxID=165716 RepID=A0A7J0ENA5_9ERIC|nr:hypothetical protein Acr_05g0016030 [Actinidia rufa]
MIAGKRAQRRVIEYVERTFERWGSGLFIDGVMGRVHGSRRDPRKDEYGKISRRCRRHNWKDCHLESIRNSWYRGGENLAMGVKIGIWWRLIKPSILPRPNGEEETALWLWASSVEIAWREELVILPAFMGFLTRIKGLSIFPCRTRITVSCQRQDSTKLCALTELRCYRKRDHQMSKRYSRARIGLAPVLFPSSSSRYYIIFYDVDRHRDEQPCIVVKAFQFHLSVPSNSWETYSYVSCPYSSPPVCLGSVVTHRGYARWMFRLHISTSVLFYRAGCFQHMGEQLGSPASARPLAQFRVDHRIPDDVVIERSGPNDDADWVEGEGDRMPIRTWFIYQAGLRFPLSKLLRSVLAICGLTFMQVSVNFVRTVLAVEALMQREVLEFTADDLFHVYCVVKPRKNLETQMLEGNHYLRLRKPNQPQTRIQQTFLEEERPVFGCNKCCEQLWTLRKVSNLLGYIPLYRYTIPLRAAHQGRPVLPPLQIRGPGSRPRSSLSDEVSNLFEGTSAELRRLLEEAKGESSTSSESSSSSWDIDLGDEALNEEAEVEDGEEVDQIPPAAPLVLAPIFLVPEPINLPSSDSDVAIVEPREIVEHSYSHSDSSSARSQLNAEVMAPKVRILGKKQVLLD